MRPTVLGIETSCDETSVAVVADGKIASNVIFSQTDHSIYGGVVPEIASRNHTRKLLPVLREALRDAGVRLEDIEGVAVTSGPGLVGCLLVGLSAAKGLAWSQGLPLVGVHHMEGHLFSGFLEHEDLRPPFVALVASGGHTDLIEVVDLGHYRYLARTSDDAAGEAFDKVAKLLGLLAPGEPTMGGPRISELARSGDPSAFDYPRGPLDEFTFSFSGLKTAVLYHLQKLSAEEQTRLKPDVAASFEAAVVDPLVEKTVQASRRIGVKRVLLAGGVAANKRLREDMEVACGDAGLSLHVPSPILCTDNAAMIAAAGSYRLERGETDGLELNADPRRPLPGIDTGAGA